MGEFDGCHGDNSEHGGLCSSDPRLLQFLLAESLSLVPSSCFGRRQIADMATGTFTVQKPVVRPTRTHDYLYG